MITYENGFKVPVKKIYNLMKSVYSSSDTFANHFEDEYPSVECLSDYLQRLQLQVGGLFLVFYDEAELIGYVFIKPRTQSNLKHTADLNMGIITNARGKGVGKEILRTALTNLSDKGIIEILYLMVRSDNIQAIKLYESENFEVLSILHNDTKIGSQYFDGILMRKYISMPCTRIF